MIECGATDWNGGLRNACEGGHVALINMMIERGATDWNAARDGSRKIREYIKAQQKLHDAKSVPIIRMLRRYTKRLCNAKRIQKWWHGTYPLWRELAYAPNGIRYQQAFKRFTQNLKFFLKK